MTSKNFTTFECSRCSTCCCVPVVPVTDSDIKRIVAEKGKPVSSFVRFYSPSEMDFDSESDVWIRFPYGKRAMGLRRRKDRCIFLDDEKSCTIYKARPMTCRTFPYMIDFDENDKPVKSSLNRIVDCKAKRKKPSPITDVIENVYIEDEEDLLYFERIREWNYRPQGGAEAFLSYLNLK
jgi:Fe-S-cluster containining protein